MTWNHRLFKEALDDGTIWYTIREVFYNDKGEIFAHMEEAVDLEGESVSDLADYIEKCKQAFNAPILDINEIKFSSDIDDEDFTTTIKNVKSYDTMQEMIDDLNKEEE